MSDPVVGPIVVLGATGHIGSRIAEFLTERHEPVRLVSRRADRLAALAERGAEPWEGSVEDADFLTRVLTGARAAFLLIPPAPGTADLRGFQRRVSEAEAAAVRASGVPYVVNLSSVGAEVPYGTGPIAGLREHEQRLNAIEGVNVLHLRPALFMENLLGGIASIRGAGVHLNPLRGDLPFPMIATQDIAAEADRLLAELGFEGKSTQELLGPRDYTQEEATRILGEAIGKPDLGYSQVSPEEARQALLGMGASESEADAYLEMVAALNSGKVHPAEPRLPENTTPTTLEEFARTVFAPVYRSAEG
jgi:uncharacterized protein YbjT (DUF2867 family)